jgi:polysaccharide export outer membrane protein
MTDMKLTLLSSVLAAGLSAAPALAQSPLPSVASARPSVATNATDYKLVVGDKLRVEVYRDAQMSQSLQIRPDGKITLPLVGDVAAAGKTPAALRDTLTTSLKEFITNPVVTVIVVEAQPQTVSVIGEVNSPGTHPIKAQTTVIEALALAGGFKDFANTKNIVIQRATMTGVKSLKFNYKDAIKSEGKPMCVEPGDVIIVP